MGWFKSAREMENGTNTSELDALQGKMLYAMDVEVEEEGEFITFISTAGTETLVDGEVDDGSTDNSGDIS